MSISDTLMCTILFFNWSIRDGATGVPKAMQFSIPRRRVQPAFVALGAVAAGREEATSNEPRADWANERRCSYAHVALPLWALLLVDRCCHADAPVAIAFFRAPSGSAPSRGDQQKHAAGNDEHAWTPRYERRNGRQ